MTLGYRSDRFALLAFTLMSVVILGGVTWGTVTTLKLERADTRERHRNALFVAAQVIDTKISTVLAQENGRDYTDFTPETYSTETILNPDGTETEGEVEKTSPLFDTSNLPNWIHLHFQVSPDNEWQSPQVRDSLQWYQSVVSIPFEELERRHGLLNELKAACVSHESLAQWLAKARYRDRHYSPAGGDDDEDDEAVAVERVSAAPPFPFSTRAEDANKWKKSTKPPEQCVTLDRAMQNVGQRSDPFVDDRMVAVSLTNLTPMWFDCDKHEHRDLAWVRCATIDGKRYYQGFLADWPKLKETLLSVVPANMIEYDLTPIDEYPDSPDGDQLPLLNLPAILVAKPAMAASTPIRWMLILPWTAAVVILAVVGFGLRAILALAERRTQFAYGVTHELRTPLTTLRLYTDMLAGGLVREDDQPKYFKTLNKEAERLSGLVNEVLEYARVENRAVKLDIRDVTLDDILQNIREHCASRCVESGKELVVDGNGLTEHTIRTDPQLVRQVVTNIIENACKYSQDADDPTITLRAVHASGGQVGLEIEDKGPGIAPADRGKIFKPFKRGGGDETKPGGIGLGLALARSWAGLLRGNLELVPQTTPGTCFRLTIPMR